MTLQQLALAIGISPRLISAIIHQRDKHYRAFDLPKKGGGARTIHAPRFFLKTVQYWLATYVLADLRVHACCHAYTRGRSILTNATPHVGKRYVANLDIKGFFDSITAKNVVAVLEANGIGNQLAHTVAELVTYRWSLPQGAPTSPIVSNAILFDADTNVAEAAERLHVTYTRYADDITLSADSRDAVARCAAVVGGQLHHMGLDLNSKKTRIASCDSSQRVTGLVVNEAVRPPRKYRRNVRSEFNHAEHVGAGNADAKKLNRLRGHLSYLSAFPALAESPELRRYALILRRLKSAN